jgi:ribonuclease P/MRP protein subunit RPP1
MYFDLNIPLPQPLAHPSSKKGKGKQDDAFSSAQVEAIEAHIDLLVHCTPSLYIHGNISDFY